MSAQPMCIMLATFNGAKWVRKQIKSIQLQTRRDWLLLVRDDGSEDATVDIVREMASEDPRIVLLLSDGKQAPGAASNFGTLMGKALATDCQLFFFCDQDDVWEQDKLQSLAQTFPQEGQEAYPLLAHSDMSIVDEFLNQLRPSMVRYMSLNVAPLHPLSYLFTRNFVTGCSAVANRELMRLATPLPARAIMHDWWLALVAAGCGKIHFVDKPLVQYRQHSNNTIGAEGLWRQFALSRRWTQVWQDGNAEFQSTLDQADALLKHAQRHSQWSPDARAQVEKFSSILELGRFERLDTARKLRLRQGNLLLRFILYLRLISVKGRVVRGG